MQAMSNFIIMYIAFMKAYKEEQTELDSALCIVCLFKILVRLDNHKHY